MKLSCPDCNGDGFLSFGDRHVENRKESCARCGGSGEIEARTGEGPESSASPDGRGLYAEGYGKRGLVRIDSERDWAERSIRAPKLVIGKDHPTRLTQLYRHELEKCIYGDCQRTVYACLLGYDSPELVPHFACDNPEAGAFWDRADAWLGEQGYRRFRVVYPGELPLTDVMRTMGVTNPGVYYVLAGISPRGRQHAVICLGDALWHDPHPDGGGVVGPTEDGYWEIEVLVATRFTEFRRPRGHVELADTRELGELRAGEPEN